MRNISASLITEAVARLAVEANKVIPPDIFSALKQARGKEPFAPAQEMLDVLIRNDEIAVETDMPICQDTGITVVYLEIGQDVHIDGDINTAVNEGVRRAYVDGLLRKSVVGDPLRRVNTGDNTPAVLHISLVPGDHVRITVAPKGCGSENMSRLKMLTPAQGRKGVVDFVLETIELAGANPCPPMIIGVGIGGDFERVAELAKQALLKPLDTPNSDPFYAELEAELLEKINATGIGPQGLGGRTTCLGVHVLAAPTHIASLPVAVNVGCHVTRHGTSVL